MQTQTHEIFFLVLGKTVDWMLKCGRGTQEADEH